MPFIIRGRREAVERGYPIGNLEPGDRCYVFYKQMVDKWKANPRWTTAHEIYKDVRKGLEWDDAHDTNDTYWENRYAQELAWQVFFQLIVMPYELIKREENGDIW